jgi:hypothetical protein
VTTEVIVADSRPCGQTKGNGIKSHAKGFKSSALITLVYTQLHDNASRRNTGNRRLDALVVSHPRTTSKVKARTPSPNVWTAASNQMLDENDTCSLTVRSQAP